jgi:hypothetical protein
MGVGPAEIAGLHTNITSGGKSPFPKLEAALRVAAMARFGVVFFDRCTDLPAGASSFGCWMRPQELTGHSSLAVMG